MDCFWEEDNDEDAAEACEGGLEPEDVAPGYEGDDYAANEGTEGWADKSPGHEPRVCCSSLNGSVDVADGGAADDEECCALEGCQTAEDEVACKNPMLNAVNVIEAQAKVHFRPYVCPKGPQTKGESPMKSMYKALEMLNMVPVVL
ncbi:hypothetical protein AC579_545 [Pseudocercospora musae]|uniref:Uncharacterized protein n=1 Tax=Pseudocercospora musae TaxID=113226 RepID=A0A139IRU4_9PEZI|nr:hypothetical protein AC579_545 [Pseudocercospora musae]